MMAKRLALATVLATTVATSGCAMWQGMTSRLGFGGERTATAQSGSGPASGMQGSGMRSPATPGSGMTMSGGPANAPMPRFSTYNECRQWMEAPGTGRTTNQGVWQGGEITKADTDPCLRPGIRG